MQGPKEHSTPTIFSLFIPCYTLQINPAQPNLPVVCGKLENTHWHFISGITQTTPAWLHFLSRTLILWFLYLACGIGSGYVIT